MDKLEVLKRADLFRELDNDQVNFLEKMCTYEVYEAGTIICKQNSTLDKLYIIEEGVVGIFLETGPLSHRQLQAACNFETFGWSAMIPPHLCKATVKALEKTTVLTFNGQDLADLCDNNCKVGCKVYQGLASVMKGRMSAAFTQLLGVTCQD